jgi:farnesyl-diphosphate farnesyltransferase
MNFANSKITSGSYDNYLEGVSRSFSFCIAQLESPLKQQVGLLYLFCRILDCIEDYKFKDKKLQWQQFDDFESFFLFNENIEAASEFQVSFRQNADIIRWSQRFPGNISEAEKILIKNTPTLLKDFYLLDIKTQEHFKSVIFEMSEGMQKYVLKKHTLNDLYEVNDYCYYVAGLVGHGLTNLVMEVCPEMKTDDSLRNKAQSFGLYLQKINLLKDQKEDEIQGRYLVPDRNEVFLSAIENAQEAFQYIEQIPLSQASYRKFCAWSLFVGLSSLPYIF